MSETIANAGSGDRVVSAFFDTAGAARQAVEDLVAAGIARDHIATTGGQDAEAATSTEGGKGWWESLRDFFLPDEDRLGYEEGLRRGGHLLTVRTDDAHHDRVLGILDTDGAVNMDDRETSWRSEGWSADVAGAVPASGLMAGSTLDAGVNAPAVVAATDSVDAEPARAGLDAGWRNDDAARSAALGTAPRAARRNTGLARQRVRSYLLDEETQGAAVQGFSPARDRSLIVERMDVISADGQKIGQVDHLEGPDRIKLTRSGSPDGQHHLVPFTWIDHVDRHVHLTKTLAEIKAEQSSSARR